jgi:hypothetical protein
MFVDALQALLTTDAGMLTFLGTVSSRADSTNGVFPSQAQTGVTMPYVVYTQASGQPLSVTMDGTGALTSERWRISCYGTTYRNAKSFAKYARLLMLSWLGPQTAGAVIIRGAFCVAETDDTEAFARGTLFSTHVDFSFNYDDNAASN